MGQKRRVYYGRIPTLPDTLQSSIVPEKPMNLRLGVFESSHFGQFAYLQALDLLSTIAFLLHGVGEANPLVRWSMSIAPHPIGGLTAVKLLAIGLAIYCVKTHREKLLSRMNLFYAGLITWNMICLVLSSKA